ncbi:MAG: metallophosphoesterase [Agitococcus sp.]|nr:metallophosphoesterase [Agitococcus sp.]MDO9177080.1 metallophosphoesterase [Agitococcus sp.]
MLRLITLPNNDIGRDFLIADLHGQYDLFLEKIASVNFNPDCDRMFSMGDLVDRGMRSLECLRLIKEPWFHFVLGNHDLALLCFFEMWPEGFHDIHNYLAEDGAWLKALTQEEKFELLNELLPLLRQAPLIVCVNDTTLPFQFVHAEILSAWGDMLPIPAVTDGAVLAHQESLTWGRQLIKRALPISAPSNQNALGVSLTPTPWEPGVRLTYAGHSIVSAPVMYRSHLFIDRGAFRRDDIESDLLLIEHAPFVTQLMRLVPRA